MSEAAPAAQNDVSRLKIAVDIGGTFTDGVALLLPENRIWVGKALTTYDDPGIAVSTVITHLMEQIRESKKNDLPALQEVIHGTTLVTNTLIERRGVTTGMVVSTGTGDVLDIRRELRYDLYDLDLALPAPLVPRALRHEVKGRLDARGAEVEPLDETQLSALAAQLRKDGVESVAIALLHSYVNPEHERQLEAHLARLLPGVSLTCSSTLSGEINEFERFSTAAANAYVKPIVEQYLNQLKNRVAAFQAETPLRIMVSSGGFVSAELAAEQPIQLLESGPAAGVISAINTVRQIDIPHVLAFDMGGTTAKACVVRHHEAPITHFFECAREHRFKRGSGLPILVPSIDLIEIGAGGCSIAHINSVGLLNVGPQSASSTPGPACYGLGGQDATVTDADLVLGYLDPGNFLGGEMQLNVELSHQALGAVGKKIGMDAQQVAVGVYEIVNENMVGAARVHIAEKGYDPRDFALVATGGAGPVHAVEVARKLGIRQVLSPVAAGAGSCLGMLAAPARVDRSFSLPCLLDDVDWSQMGARFDAMKEQAYAEIAPSLSHDDELLWRITLDMRYAGQGGLIPVSRQGHQLSDEDSAYVRNEFERIYQQIYGRVVPQSRIEIVTWRLTAETAESSQSFAWGDSRTMAINKAPRKRSIYLPHKRQFAEVSVYDRYALPAGTQLPGPLVLEERESTIVVPVESDVQVLDNLTVSILIKESE